MSAGSWLGTGKGEIGNLPGDMTAWDKLQLGWLDYDKAKAATKSTHKLGVSEYNTKDKQALVVELPEKAVTTTVTKPAEGSKQWWSDMGDDRQEHPDPPGRPDRQVRPPRWTCPAGRTSRPTTTTSTPRSRTTAAASWTALDGTADGKADHP